MTMMRAAIALSVAAAALLAAPIASAQMAKGPLSAATQTSGVMPTPMTSKDMAMVKACNRMNATRRMTHPECRRMVDHHPDMIGNNQTK